MISEISQDIEVTLRSLKANHFDAQFAQTADEAKKMILEMIPLSASVGVGDSVTLRQIGILEELIRRGTEVINPFTQQLTRNMAQDPAIYGSFLQTIRRTFNTDVFLTSSNAVTQDGKIVSIDFAGNRVAGTTCGAKKVILPIGKNKIVKDLNEAIYRIKNVIAPAHAKGKERKTPCVVTGKCNDCDSPDRICNATIILEKKPFLSDLSVIIINENLGLGWDPTWNEKCISDIRSNYDRNTWVFFAPDLDLMRHTSN